jgi:uncharacterized membrane protein YqjE
MNVLNMKELLENLQGFVETNIELAKLEVQEKINESIKKVIDLAGMFIFGSLFIIFFLIFLAMLISHFTGSYILGFGILCLSLFFYFFKQKKGQKIEEIET